MHSRQVVRDGRLSHEARHVEVQRRRELAARFRAVVRDIGSRVGPRLRKLVVATL